MTENSTNIGNITNSFKEKYNFQSLIERMDVLVFICTGQMQILLANKVLINYLGFDPAGQTCKEAFVGSDVMCPACLQPSVQDKQFINLQFYNKKRNVWIQGVAIPVNIEDTTLRIAMLRELDRLPAFSDELLYSDPQNRMVLDILNDGIEILDNEDTIKFVNKRLSEITGYEFSELIGQDLKKFLSQKEIDLFEKVQNGIKSGDTKPYEVTLQKKDGKIVNLIISGRPIVDEQGICKGVINAVVDITEIRKIEEELQESNNALLAIYDSMTDGLAIADPDTKRFIEVNDAMCAMLGYTREEFLNSTAYDIHPEEIRQTIIDTAFNRHKSNERFIDYSVPVLRKDGTIFYADVSSNSIEYKGQQTAIGFFRDITHRKNIEEALKKTQWQQQAILDNIPDIAWLKDTESRYIAVNEALAKAFATPREDFVGKNDSDFSPPELAQMYMRDDKKVIEQKTRIVVEEPWTDKDGNYSTIETIKIPIFADNGEVIGTAGISRDITGRKKIEEELKRTQTVQRAILDNIPDIAWLKDTESVIISANEPYAEAAGCTTEELVGKTDLDFFPKHLAEKYRQDDQEVIKSGKRLRVEEPFVSKDGKLTMIDTVKTPIYDDKGQILGTIGIARDVTERKTMEEELKRIQSVQKAILDNIPDIAWLKDLDSNYITVNESFAALAGYKREQLEGKTDLDIFPLELAKKYRQDDQEVIKSGKRLRVEEPFIDKNGNMTMIDTVKTPIYDDKGQIIGTTGISRDVTERKKYEEEINNKNKMLAEKTIRLEELNTLKNEFLGMAAHDLRNPLNAILNTSAFMLVFQNESFTEEQHSMLRLIKNSSEKLLSIVTDFLDVTAIEAGTINLNKKIVHLSNMIDLHELPSVFSKQKNINIDFDIAQNLPAVEVDLDRIHQVMENLIDNAVKFSPPESTITLRVRKSDENLEISIIDQGQGIPPEDMENLFKPFKKKATKYQGVEKSTGLGLAIAKKIVELHNGTLSVKSEVNKGSEFIIRLPIAKQD